MDVTDPDLPKVDVQFTADNPYQRSYRVRDVSLTGEAVDHKHPHGMEDYFRSVMVSSHRLHDPHARQHNDDPYWLIRFAFVMGSHFAAMPPFHFEAEVDGTLTDSYQAQRRPVAIYCEGVKWLNWALEMLRGERFTFLGVACPPLPSMTHYRHQEIA